MYFYYWPIQHPPSPDICGPPLQRSYPWKWERFNETWLARFCNCVWKCKLPLWKWCNGLHQWMLMEFIPPYSPFLNPVEESLSAWRWKINSHWPQDQMYCWNGCHSRRLQRWLQHVRRCVMPKKISGQTNRSDVTFNEMDAVFSVEL